MKPSTENQTTRMPTRNRRRRRRKVCGETDGYRPIRAKERERASLGLLCDLVVTYTCPYSDLAETIENRAYDEWKRGNVETAVEHLRRVAVFFEWMENKNEENIRDLADVYFLIGQLYQYAGWHAESIEWFAKSIFVDDRNSFPYHCMGVSYLKCGNIHNAMRSFEQELAIDEGNYFTYLQLAGLYVKEGQREKAEECLKSLLTRDPDNIQGIHQLIRHYERYNPSIDASLLRKRLLGIVKKFNWMEAMLRSYYLFRERRHAEALACLSAWEKGNRATSMLHCVKAYILGENNQAEDADRELAALSTSCRSRAETMLGVVEEFGEVFGESAADRIAERFDRGGKRRLYPEKKAVCRMRNIRPDFSNSH